MKKSKWHTVSGIFRLYSKILKTFKGMKLEDMGVRLASIIQISYTLQ